MIRQLKVDAVDEALDLFDLLMATKLLAKAERLSDKAKLRSERPRAGRGAAANAQRVCRLLPMRGARARSRFNPTADPRAGQSSPALCGR